MGQHGLEFVSREEATRSGMLTKAKGQAFRRRRDQLSLMLLAVVSKVVELVRTPLFCVLVGLLAAPDVCDDQGLGPLGNGSPVGRFGVFFHLLVYNRQRYPIEAFCFLDDAV